MVQRGEKRGDTIREPEALLKSLGSCRDALIKANIGVKPQGPAYHAIHLVVSAIDTLAFFMTGQPYYFSVGSSYATDGERRARENKPGADYRF